MAVSIYFATNRNPISGPVPNNFGTDFHPSGEVPQHHGPFETTPCGQIPAAWRKADDLGCVITLPLP